MKRLQIIKGLLAILLVAGATLLAQSPTGTVAGIVTDSSGAVIPEVQITIVNKDTGLSRISITGPNGAYSAAALPAGSYVVKAEAKGFSTLVRQAVVEAGTTTTADLSLGLGEVAEQVTVEGALPQIHYDSAQIGGVVTRSQTESLPLNGRSFFELAKLEPGVQPPTRASGNRTLVSVMGAPAGGAGSTPGGTTRVTADGGSIMAVGNAGAAMGFSQEVVQEFQIATVNFDLSTGITASGSINIVTRSGGNDLHGAAFYFFRDRKSTRLNSSHIQKSRMPSSA